MSQVITIHPQETIIETSPEIIEEVHVVDLYLAHNGQLEVHSDIEVTVNYDSADLTVATIQNRVYPITRKQGDKLFYTRPTFDTTDAFLLPAVMVYAVFSTFLNIQLYINPENLITFPNFVLLLMNLAIGLMWGTERTKRTTKILFIKVKFRSFETVEWLSESHKPLLREFEIYRGYSGRQLFSMFSAGIATSLPFALAPIVYTIDNIVSFVAVGLFLLLAIGQIGADKKQVDLMHNPPKQYGLGVVSAEFDNRDLSGESDKEEMQRLIYNGLGVFVPIRGDEKEREKRIKELKKKGEIIGVRPVYEAENVLESPDRNYATILSEAYKDHDYDNEKFEVLSSERAREILKETKKALDDADKPAFEKKAVSEIIRYYDGYVRLLRNALTWLGMENKTRTEVQKADKITIRNQQAVISTQRLDRTDINVQTTPIDWNPALKWGTIIVGSMVLFFFILYLQSTGYI